MQPIRGFLGLSVFVVVAELLDCLFLIHTSVILLSGKVATKIGLYSEDPGALSLISNMNSNRLRDYKFSESHTVSTEEKM